MHKNCLQLGDFKKNELLNLVNRAIELKKNHQKDLPDPLALKNKSVAMIFSQSSTRTRVSFEVAINQLGGHAIFLAERDSQISRGEPVKDTARVLSSMVDLIIIRHPNHQYIQTLAEFSDVPIINALSNQSHPCQLLADMQTFYELRGSIKGKKVAWIGDCNNMYFTYVEASQLFEFDLRIAIPESYFKKTIKLPTPISNSQIKNQSPYEACKDADLIVTDTWISMSTEQTSQNNREKDFQDYQVNEDLMKVAKKDALFLHCLPAYRGKEVSSEVLESTQSGVWKAAENRLYAQKALLEFLLS